MTSIFQASLPDVCLAELRLSLVFRRAISAQTIVPSKKISKPG